MKGNCIFITLTYSNENLPKYYSLVKKDVQDYMKRLRKRIFDTFPEYKKIKYFVAGEYGEQTHRPHYHVLIFNMTFDDYQKLSDLNILGKSEINDTYNYTCDIWTDGHVNFGYDTSSHVVRYVAKYINKKTYGSLTEKVYGKRQPPFQLCSQGLGLSEALKHSDLIKKRKYIYRDGLKLSIPSYYKDKLGITAEDFKEIIELNDKILIDKLSGMCKTVFIEESKLTPDIIERALKEGRLLDDKVLTPEAMDAWRTIRRQANDNIRAKRNISELKNPDKL